MTHPTSPKVLLVELVERTSASGNSYLSGWMGKARLIGFWADGEDRDGTPCRMLRVYAQEPGQKPQERQEQASRPSQASATPMRPERDQRAAVDAQRRHADALANLNGPITDEPTRSCRHARNNLPIRHPG